MSSTRPYIVADRLDDLMREVIVELQAHGQRIAATRGETLEVAGVLLELTEPRARLSRSETKGTLFSCLGEFIWYMSGDDSNEVIDYYVPGYSAGNSDDGLTIHGAYGPRLSAMRGEIDQLANIRGLLQARPNSRRAVIQLFNAEDIQRAHKEIPCTCTLQFLLRGDKLNMLTHMRSNDAFIGLPHDVFAFTMIQEYLAAQLGVQLGTYKHAVGSLHMYEKHDESAGRFLSEGWQSHLPMPNMPEGDVSVSLDALIAAAKDIREGVQATIPESIDSYWSDLIEILKVYHATRPDSANLEEAEAASDRIANHVYKPFISRRLDRLRNPPSTDAQQIPGGRAL